MKSCKPKKSRKNPRKDIKSSRHHFLKFANKGKLEIYQEFLMECILTVQWYINYLWENQIFIKEKLVLDVKNDVLNCPQFISTKQTFPEGTNLSQRALKSCATQACGIVQSAIRKRSKMIWLKEKLKAEGKDISGIFIPEIFKPILDHSSKLELNSLCAKLVKKKNGHFDNFLVLSSIGKAFGKIALPIKGHAHANGLKNKGRKLMTSFLFSPEHIEMRWEKKERKHSKSPKSEKPISAKKKKKQAAENKRQKLANNSQKRIVVCDKKDAPNNSKIRVVGCDRKDAPNDSQKRIVGCDTGLNTVATFSDGQATGKDCHGHDLKSITKIMSRKQKGSKAMKKTMDHRKNYINWALKQIDLSNIDQINLEKVTNFRYKKRTKRQLNHWTNSLIEKQLKNLAREQDVPVIEQSSAFKSQRCSNCGYTHYSNRQGENFACKICSFPANADYNGSCNQAQDLPDAPLEFGRLYRKSGFYWNEAGFFDKDGKELTVPSAKQRNKS